MNTTIVFAALCALSSFACDVSCLEDCDDFDECSEHDHGDGGHKDPEGKSGNSNASGGASGSGSSSNSGESGGTAASAGKGGGASPKTPCTQESDCARAFNCDYERKECVEADAETCPELSSETACDNRNDCMSIYAGTNCSCGPECACVGGEPGCVCESFAFFRCEPIKG